MQYGMNAKDIPDEVIQEAYKFIEECLRQIGDDYISPREVDSLMDILRVLTKAQYVSLQVAMCSLADDMMENMPSVLVVVQRGNDTQMYKH